MKDGMEGQGKGKRRGADLLLRQGEVSEERGGKGLPPNLKTKLRPCACVSVRCASCVRRMLLQIARLLRDRSVIVRTWRASWAPAAAVRRRPGWRVLLRARPRPVTAPPRRRHRQPCRAPVVTEYNNSFAPLPPEQSETGTTARQDRSRTVHRTPSKSRLLRTAVDCRHAASELIGVTVRRRSAVVIRTRRRRRHCGGSAAPPPGPSWRVLTRRHQSVYVAYK